MERLTGLDAYGDVISTEEYSILATRDITDKEKEDIKNHILEKLYKCEDKETELENLTKLFAKTFYWGNNDTAKILYANALYANAVYAVISGNKIFEERINEFKNYMLDK